MKCFRISFCCCLLLFCAAPYESCFAGWGDVLKSVTQGAGTAVPDTKVAEGLKEALKVGTENAVGLVSKPGGYFDNPGIRIGLPAGIGKFESVIRMAGYGPQLDAFEHSMNQAAEKAAPHAESIFLDALGQMSIDDAQKILHGGDDAATVYFKGKTYDRLYGTFKPLVSESMSQVGVTRSFQDLNSKATTLPMVGGFSPDLNDYVTRGALDGLFYMIAQEEKKIRQNPAARVTDLLKEVFSR